MPGLLAGTSTIHLKFAMKGNLARATVTLQSRSVTEEKGQGDRGGVVESEGGGGCRCRNRDVLLLKSHLKPTLSFWPVAFLPQSTRNSGWFIFPLVRYVSFITPFVQIGILKKIGLMKEICFRNQISDFRFCL